MTAWVKFQTVDNADRIPASFPVGLAWYVVYCNINCEARAQQGLIALGFKTYLPQLRKWIKHARKRQAVHRPLFTRYLFVGFDINRDAWFPIRSTPGVERVLCRDGVPESVPSSVIERLMAAQRMGRFDLTRTEAMLKPGDRVEVEGGPFGDFIAEVATADDGKRVEILHHLFGRLTRMKLDVARVRQCDVENP
jgi:transcriptional antiterminator RfaH